MMKRIPELLVPAGGRKQLEAAVSNGADAVYMSGSLFNARAGAENFTDEQIKDAIIYAHTYGVKVHIAMNILIRDDEMEQAFEFARRMYEYGADALIIQDLGLISLVRRCIPDMPVHFSTQGTIYDIEGVREAARMGVSRVILARELSLDEIRSICAQSDIEIEIFVHGAICICYSGQCHMSGMIGGRSGNRGECAQPCRLMNRLIRNGNEVEAEGCLLSPSDMSLLTHLEEIADAGVSSLKIEGRMKSPEYVAVTAAVYRKHLDIIAEGGSVSVSETAGDIGTLRQVFSRGQFTDAYFRGSTRSDLMSAVFSKHQGIRIGQVVSVNRKRGHLTVKLTSRISNGDGIEIRDRGKSCGNIVTYIRDRTGKLIREAGPGMTVAIGDIDLSDMEYVPEGMPVYRLTDSELMKAAGKTYEKTAPRIRADLMLEAVTGRKAVLKAVCVQDEKIYEAEVSSESELVRAEGRPLEHERAEKSLSKTGGTPYYPGPLKTVIKGEPFLSASELNAMRRGVLDALTEKRLDTGRSPEDIYFENAGLKPGVPAERDEKTIPETVVYFYDVPDVKQCIRNVLGEYMNDRELFEYCEFAVPYRLIEEDGHDVPAELKSAGVPVSAVLPVIARDQSGSCRDNMKGILQEMFEKDHIRSVYIGNISQLGIVKETGIPFRYDMSMNAMNTETLDHAYSLGALSAALSAEPDAAGSVYPGERLGMSEIMIYGRLPAMVTAHCPIGSRAECFAEGKNRSCSDRKKYRYCRSAVWELEDRKGARFRVIGNDDDCSAVIYSHKPVDIMNDIMRLRKAGARRFRISVLEENERIGERVRAVKNAFHEPGKH